MLFKEYLNKPCGIRFMFDSLNLMSSVARKMILYSGISNNKKELENYYKTLEKIYNTLYNNPLPEVSSTLASVKHKLLSFRDIDGTMQRLINDVVLDDIDLFEIKYLSMLSNSLKKEIKVIGYDVVNIPDLDNVVDILDPDKLNIESFYIYNSYSKDLENVRKELKKHSSVDDLDGVSSERLLELLEKEKLLEAEIRGELSKKLKNYYNDIKKAIEELGKLDIILAKALQIKELQLSFPKISYDNTTSYKGMFHPQIVDMYNRSNADSRVGNKIFTPIDISFGLESIAIIGANMGGKTVVLKMLALNQLLFQFGFGVAAKEAIIDIKDDIEICIGDDQNIEQGLSSFAGEIKAIDRVLQRVENGERVLALIDEPARTTNPVEGTALVTALIKMLIDRQSSVLITTHYNVVREGFKRLRVNGLKDGVMDYRLKEALQSDVPCEALNIAKMLGVNKKWIDSAEKEIEEIYN